MDTFALDLNRHPYSSSALTNSNSVSRCRWRTALAARPALGKPGARSAEREDAAAPRRLTHGAPYPQEV